MHYMLYFALKVSNATFQMVSDGKEKPSLLVCVCLCVCVSLCEGADNLVAATRSDHHVAVFLEDDVRAVIKVEHGDGVELRGSTTRFRNRLWVNEMNLHIKREEKGKIKC